MGDRHVNATGSSRLGLIAPALAALLLASTAALADNVVTYHNSNQRMGAYVAPALTQTAASGIHFDPGFTSSYTGNVYAQPLFYHPKNGNPMVLVATESNAVIALDAATGATIWTAQLPAPVPSSDLPCGNINPEGITGTPVIDTKSGTLYLDALTLVSNAPTHQIFALSLENKGAILPGWPVSVDALAKAAGLTFTSYTQGNRSGALLFGGDIFFSYAGRSGDCGTYHGTVVQIDPAKQSLGGLWQTRASGGGIWAQGGTSSDGKSLFVTTGNTMGADNNWQDGEAILRLKPGLAHSTDTKDYYAPSNWQSLDNSDKDLGGTEAIPLDVFSGRKHSAPRVIAFGKDGNAYLVDRPNLGGIGGQINITSVSNSVIITAPAVYSTAAMTMVAFTNYSGQTCSGNDLTMLDIKPSGTAPITTAWCQPFNGGGAPMVTTTDGTNNPIVWVVGAEGDNELHGFDAVKGTVLFSGSGSGMQGLRHFQTLISAEGRLYVGADNKVYAFTY
jgi:outer membrane protein assembly factor BamB